MDSKHWYGDYNIMAIKAKTFHQKFSGAQRPPLKKQLLPKPDLCYCRLLQLRKKTVDTLVLITFVHKSFPVKYVAPESAT